MIAGCVLGAVSFRQCKTATSLRSWTCSVPLGVHQLLWDTQEECCVFGHLQMWLLWSLGVIQGVRRCHLSESPGDAGACYQRHQWALVFEFEANCTPQRWWRQRRDFPRKCLPFQVEKLSLECKTQTQSLSDLKDADSQFNFFPGTGPISKSSI